MIKLIIFDLWNYLPVYVSFRYLFINRSTILLHYHKTLKFNKSRRPRRQRVN